MKDYKSFFILMVVYAYIFLFSYAAISKLLDFELFQLQLGQSPIVSSYAGIISYFVIIIELMICGFLMFGHTRSVGLYLSTGLMISFTFYIYLILNFAENIPCSCGGVLEKMTWRQHLLFNFIFVLLGFIAIIFHTKWRNQPRRNSILSLSCVFFIPILIVGILFRSSDYLSKKENPFIRKFIPHAIKKESSIDLGVNSYYFAGIGKDGIYLGNPTSPFLLTVVNTNLKNIKEQKIIPQPNHYRFQRPRFYVHEERFFLHDGTVPVILGSTLEKNTVKAISEKEFYFDLLNIDDGHFAFRSQTKEDGFVFGLYDFNNKKIQISTRILQKQADGFFDSDGSLMYDPILKNHVYVYRYRNQFIVFDNTLQKIKFHNTIDTMSVAQVQTQMLKNGQNKMNIPPLVVNTRGTVYDGVLFNISHLIGKFEDPKLWKNSFIIDLYSTKEGMYLGSLYIPKSKGVTQVKITIDKNYLYVLQGNEMFKYRFAQNVLQHFDKGESRKP